MTKVGILDDEIIICETLQKYLVELGYNVLDYALNYDEAIEMYTKHKPDIMLLDINLNNIKTGIDFANFLRQNANIPLIFISSYSDKKTLDTAKNVKPNGYLVKPFNKADLYTAIEIAINNFEEESPKNSVAEKLLPDAFFIKQDSFFVKIYFDNLLYIKSEGVYVEIFTKEKKHLYRDTLKKIIEVLPSNLFVQTHRSYIVNLKYIDAINKENVIISDQTIPVSSTYSEQLLSRLNIFNRQ